MFGLFKLKKSDAIRKLVDDLGMELNRMKNCQAMEYPRRFIKLDDESADRDFVAAVLAAGIVRGLALHEGFELGLRTIHQELQCAVDGIYPNASACVDECINLISDAVEQKADGCLFSFRRAWLGCPAGGMAYAAIANQTVGLWLLPRILRSPADISETEVKEVLKLFVRDIAVRASMLALVAKDVFDRGIK